MSRVLGAILAGGRSRRFGSDKAMAHLHGKTLLAHVADRLTPQVDAVIICGDAIGEIADRPGGGLGPLAGLNAALHHAARFGFAAVLSAPCDTPLLPDDLARRLHAGEMAAFGRDNPVIGWWPCALAPRLDAYLANSRDRSMQGWAAACGAVSVDIGPIANVNFPSDLEPISDRFADPH